MLRTWGFLVLALAVAASPPPRAGSSEPQTGASRVVLAAVTDPRNRPLVDVSADDFVIQEAGAPREILSVRAADYPIVVLLDTGIDARADFALMQKATAHVIERVGPRPIAVGTFGGAPKMLTTFADERQDVLARLAAATAETAGGSLLLCDLSDLGGCFLFLHDERGRRRDCAARWRRRTKSTKRPRGSA